MHDKCSDAIRYLGRQASRTHNYFLRLRGSFFFFFTEIHFKNIEV